MVARQVEVVEEVEEVEAASLSLMLYDFSLS